MDGFQLLTVFSPQILPFSNRVAATSRMYTLFYIMRVVGVGMRLYMSAGYRCFPSGCTDLFCREHKDAIFRCATPGCPNLVHTQVIFGPSEFLDNGYDDAHRTVAGVLIDATKCRRKPTPYVDTGQTTTEANGELKPIIKKTALTEKEQHEYYCEYCSLNIHQGKLPKVVTSGKVTGQTSQFTHYHKDKHLRVPEDMRRIIINGHHVEIRVLGPGMSENLDKFYTMERFMQTAVYGEERPGCDQKQSLLRLPVPQVGDLHRTGLQKRANKMEYNSLLGLFVDGVLAGRCILQLMSYQTKSQGRIPCDTVMINHIFIDENTRALRLGLGHLLVLYCIKMTRLLNHDFGSNINKVVLCTKPENTAMNRVAMKSGFTLQYRGDCEPFGNFWTFSLNTSVEEACDNNRQTRFKQHLSLAIDIHTKRKIKFAFVFNYKDTLHTAMHSVLMPRCSIYMNNECNVTCYKIYEHIESCNQHRPQKAWMLAQSVFFQSLSHDEHLTLLTYSAYGEEINQHCTRQCDTHRLTDIGYYKRTADWYVATIDSLQYLMFQPQICEVFGYSTTLSPEDIKRISFDMQTWDIQRWHRVFEVYMEDIQKLFLKAPPLLYPMTSFKGEPNTTPQLPKGVCVTWERTIPSPGLPFCTTYATYKFCDLEADAFE